MQLTEQDITMLSSVASVLAVCSLGFALKPIADRLKLGAVVGAVAGAGFRKRRKERQIKEKLPRMPLIAVAVALIAVAGGGAGAWFDCLIPGVEPASCGGSPTAGSADGAAKPDEALTCAGLSSGDACYAVAEKALAKGQLEPARQLFQQAATLGSLEASVAVARMYDPETWAAEASSAAEPNWETAVHGNGHAPDRIRHASLAQRIDDRTNEAHGTEGASHPP